MENANSALLIVDVQKGFITDRTRHIPTLVQRVQEDYAYVFVCLFQNIPGSPFRTVFDWHGCTPGTEDCEPAFTPREDAVIIEKFSYSCVSEELLFYFRRLGVERVDVCGIDTDVCVLRTASELFEKGYCVRVLKDLCATTAGEEVSDEAALAVIARHIGKDNII